MSCLRSTGLLVAAVLSLGGVTSATAASEPGERLGAEFLVNTSTTLYQYGPEVAADADGDFVVVWESSDGANEGIFGQRYNANGTRRGSEFRIDTSGGYVGAPKVGMTPDGAFVVTWARQVPGQPYFDILARRYSSSGLAQGGEASANGATPADGGIHGLAAGVNGNFVVVWKTYYNADIQLRRYAASGALVGADMRVNSVVDGVQTFPAIAVDKVGNFAVVWASQKASGYDIYGQRFSSDGDRLGEEFKVNSTTSGGQFEPKLAMNLSGEFIVTWAGSGASGDEIFVRRFSGSGMPAGTEFLANTFSVGNQQSSHLDMSEDGRAVVVWRSNGQDGSGYGVYGQRISPEGELEGAEFPVNSYTEDDQFPGGIAMDADGDFVVVWQSCCQDGSGFGVFGQRFAGSEAVDLALTKKDLSDPVMESGYVSYSLTVSNNHPVVAPTGLHSVDSAIGAANTLQVRDVLPSGLGFNGAYGTDWTCTHSGGVVFCEYSGSLLPMTTSAITISAKAAAGERTITNTATISGAQYDPTSANNSDSEDTYICSAAASSVAFAASQYSATEGGSATIQVTRTGGNCSAVGVSYAMASGTAESGADYAPKSGSLAWAAGERGQRSFTVQILQDTIDETQETLNVILSDPTGEIGIGSPKSAVLAIADDDEAPTVSISTLDTAIDEGQSFPIVVSLSAPSGKTISVPFSFSGAAVSGTDYTVSTSGPVSIPAGSTSAVLVTVNAVDDVLDEAVETLTVNLGTPNNADLGIRTSHQLNIGDNDPMPTVVISTESETTEEAASGNKTIDIKLSAPSGREITVGLDFGGTATLGSDYVGNSGAFILFPGRTSATLSLTVKDDALDEYDESLIVNLVDLVNVGAGSDTSYTLNITDNDPTPTVSFASAAQTVGEGAGSATVNAQPSAVSGRAITVPFTRSGSATSPADYSVSAQQIAIPAGSTSGSVTVNLVDDSNIELSEKAVFTMGAPVNATSGSTTTHTLTIKDNDPISLP